VSIPNGVSFAAALGLDLPVLAAPMAGAPSTTRLVKAAASAGGIGFLAAGYKSAELVADQIAEMHRAGVSFGVNLFAPNPTPVRPADFHRYAAEIAPDAAEFGIDLSEMQPLEDDDQWRSKIDVLLANPAPLVSFTFGLPPADVVAVLQRADSRVLVTVTNAREAAEATELRPDALVVQSGEAGGHSGTFTPSTLPVTPVVIEELVSRVRAITVLPLIAAGGIATPERVRDAIAAGADAVMVGTFLLRTDESGAGRAQKHAMTEGRGTVVTRAFTGRPARALRNRFTESHTASAPLGYPALHHLTSGMRAAAAKAGDAEHLNLWAGTGYASAPTGSAATAIRGLTRLL
jgi:nitronate monooxygenase